MLTYIKIFVLAYKDDSDSKEWPVGQSHDLSQNANGAGSFYPKNSKVKKSHNLY